MHIPDEPQILLVPARLADGTAPFFYGLEDLHLHPAVPDGRALREAADELVEELLGADLQLEGVAAVLDADVEQIQGEHGDIGVAVVDVVNDGDGGLAGGRALLGVDEVGDLEVQGEVGLVVLRTAGGLDEALELRRDVAAPSSPRVPGGRPCAGRLHCEVSLWNRVGSWVVRCRFRVSMGGCCVAVWRGDPGDGSLDQTAAVWCVPRCLYLSACR